MPASPPTQATVVQKNGILTQLWILFFASLVGKPGSSAPLLTTGEFNPAAMSDSVAANNSIYYSTDSSKLVFKDPGGVVHDLY